MKIPLIISFWFMIAAYVIHVIDESLLGSSFVEKVQQHWWAEYSWEKFFWFNAGYFVIMIASVVAYDLGGGNRLILPLAWAIERLCNGFWHVWWTIHFREYSPGLLSSILIWMDSYFIIRYRPVEEVITPETFWFGADARTPGRCFSGFLHSSGKRQGNASEGCRKRKVKVNDEMGVFLLNIVMHGH